MPETPRFYRLRIRDKADSTDALVVTSVRGGSNPYISRPPSGDGQSFDPIDGSVKTGSYTVQVIDADLGGGSRVVTAVLADATARQQLISNRAYVESSTDGSSWVAYAPGFVNRITLISAISYEIAIGDSRRVETSTEVFKSLVIRKDPITQAPTYSRFADGATYIIGGPVKTQFWTSRDNGGWHVKVSQVVAGSGGGTLASTGYVQLKLQRYGSFDPKKTFFGHDEFATKAMINWLNEATQGYFVSSQRWMGSGIQGYFPRLVYRVELADHTLVGLFTPVAEPYGVDVKRGDYLTRPGESSFWVNWTGTVQPNGSFVAAPSVGTDYYLYLTALDISDKFPLHVQGHPVDIHEKLWLDYGIAYDASVLPAVKAAIGNDLSLDLRITSSSQFDAAEQMLDGLFGLATRVNGAGQRVLFTTRIKDSAPPAVSITTSSLRGEGKVFDLDEGGVSNKVTLKQLRFITFTRDINDNQDTGEAPPDALLTAPEVIEVENGDSQTPGDHETVFELEGRITNAAGAEISAEDFIVGIAQEMFDRFGRGPIATELPCLPDIAALLGQEVTLNIPHLPNAVAGATPVSQRGGNRIVQIVQRTETPEGADLKFLDAGTSVQASIAPTFTVAANATDPRKFVDIAITNGPALAAAGIKVRIEVATGASAPTSGTLLSNLEPAVRTSIVAGPYDAGTKVWVRMRSELNARRPSAWTAFSSVDLTDLDAPTSLAVSAQDATDISRRTLTWVPGTNALDIPVEVYLRLTADPSSSDRLVAVLPPGSDQYELTGLDVANRTATVLHRETAPAKGQSASATVAVNTTGTSATLPAPTNPLAFAGVSFNGGRPVADGRFGMTMYANVIPSGIEVQVAVGAGSFVSQPIIESVPGAVTVFTAFAPNDGLIRHLRARHVKRGYTESAWTPEVTIYPWSTYAPPPPDSAPRFNFLKLTGTVLDIIGSDPQTKSIRVYDTGGTWEYVLDGTNATIDVSQPGTNGVAGLGSTASSTFRIQLRSDPTTAVDADTLITEQDMVISGGSASAPAATWDTPGLSLSAPALGSSNIGITLKATGAPAGWDVKVYIGTSPNPTADRTALLSPSLSAPPTSSTTYTYDTERIAVHDPPRTYVTFYVKADLRDSGGTVIDTRSAQVSFYASDMV